MGICAALCLSLLGLGAPQAPVAGASFFATTGVYTGLGTAPAAPFQASSAAVTDDASLVVFSIYGAKLYFRNLNQFNPEWQGCCYNYYIDLTTDDGKAMYAFFMSQRALRGRLVLWRGSAAPGPIEQMGNW